MSEVTLTDSNFDQEVKKFSGAVLVDFWAPWCGPCQMMGPVVEELAKKYDGKVKVAKLNVDENPAVSQQFQVMSIPTFIFFKDGEEKERMVGAHDRETLQDKIESYSK